MKGVRAEKKWNFVIEKFRKHPKILILDFCIEKFGCGVEFFG